MENFKLHDGDGKPSEFSIKRVGIVLGLVLVIAATWIYGMGGLSGGTTRSSFEPNVYEKVLIDAVDQYNIAKRQGDPVQVCVQAGMVAAAYLQEKNESSYQSWKTIEKSDCAHAGMPQ